MSRLFESVFLCLFLVACNQSSNSSLSACQKSDDLDGCSALENQVSPVEDPSGTPVPNEAFTFDTDIEFLNTTPEQQEKFERAIEIIKKVVATEEFRNQIYNFTYNGKQLFVDNGGKNNAEIYEMILEAAEKLTPSKNNIMDMEVELYYADTTTIGYTYPNVTKIWVNTKFFDKNPVTSVAANLMHEWLHKLGFTHAVTYSASRDYSVPYAIGRLVGSLGAQINE